MCKSPLVTREVRRLVFELAKTARLRTFRYVIVGGDTGVWDLSG
jgi:hypothetical protein